MSALCYCNSKKLYSECCQPLLARIKEADSPEQLMRSRFTAYCLSDFNYILDTYAPKPRNDLSVEILEDSADDNHWFTLSIPSNPALDKNQVEFFAYYFVKNKPYVLHETSRFEREGPAWRYTDGHLHPDCGKLNIGRNDPCVCTSGKKFKQCCFKKAR